MAGSLRFRPSQSPPRRNRGRKGKNKETEWEGERARVESRGMKSSLALWRNICVPFRVKGARRRWTKREAWRH